MNRFKLMSIVLFCFLGVSSDAFAATHYVDPVAGSSAGDGTIANPWRTVQEVVEMGLIETRHWSVLPYAAGASLEVVNPTGPVKPGDTLILKSGFHGALVLNGAYNSTPILVQADPNAATKPQVSEIVFRGASGWHIKGLAVSPSFGTGDVTTIVDIVSHNFHGPSDGIEIEGCDIFTVPDISGWSGADWIANARDGVITNGDDIVIRDNHVFNTKFGISSSGLRALISSNRVRNFSGDGLRGLGDFNVFEYNYVANSYDVDENHDDGFQSWSRGPQGVGTGEVRGVVLRGNFILNREDPDQPLSGPLQGIGGFDGFFVDWVIENNVVIVDHFHGITLTGARNTTIRNNTVLNFDSVGLGPPWIKIAPHKDGRAGSGNTIRNNLVTDMTNEEVVVEDHNLIISDPLSLFVDPTLPAWDLHLLPTADAIDAGMTEADLLVDRDGVSRPQGAATDIGAYEWSESTPGDPDLGSDGDAGGAGTDGGSEDMSQNEDSGSGSNGSDANGNAIQVEPIDSGASDGCSTVTRPTSMGSFFLLLLSFLIGVRTRRRL